MEPATKKLPFKVKAGFGICDLGGNLFFTVIAFWLLNYLTDTVGMAAGTAGIVVGIGKIWDAVTDPVVGYMSDRTRTKWGRRRPYLFAGSFPLFVAMIVMFTNPGFESPTALFIWAVVSFCFLNTAYTVVNIPYSAMTPELTTDFNERTTLNGYRFGCAIVGTLLGAGATLPIITAFPNRNAGFTAVGVIFGALMMITALITVFTVKEPEHPRTKPRDGFFSTYFSVFKNKPYVLILLTYAFNVMGITVVSGIMVYYFKYIYNDEPKTTLALLVLLVTAMATIPVSVVVAKKTGKKLVYLAGMLIVGASAMTIFLFGHTWPMHYTFITMFFAGIGLGATMALPYAMVCDAIECDYLATGERREGAFYGIWTFVLKIGQAVAIGLMGLILNITGYVPDVAQTPEAMFGIRLIFGPISASLFVVAVVLLWFYPLNEERYNKVLDEIRLMEARREAEAAPLL
jgi:GPH family glycoside/pentoside/hexuronide:cation symporter